MKAIVCEQYGGPEVLKIKALDKPIPDENQILVKIKAVSINPYEWHHMRGKPYFMRLIKGLFKPKYPVLGNDVSGIVETIGDNVTSFKPGDEIFGDIYYGGLAEYACTAVDKIVLKSPGVTFEEAASLPIAGITALQGIRDYADVRSGQHVLINGASGGVGTFAVQIAKAFGATVTGVCSTRNIELVKSIGADEVIDYSKRNFTKEDHEFDVIYDVIGNHKASILRKRVKPGGRVVVAGFTTMRNMIGASMLEGRTRKKATRVFMQSAKPNTADLNYLNNLQDAGKIKPVIERTYSLEDTPEAMRYLETMRARGKVIIKPA